MRVINIHTRRINQPAENVSAVLDTLSSPDDQLWPFENWPAMVLDNGLAIGSAGGHGPVAYVVARYSPGKRVVFRFLKPAGYLGTHTFEVTALDARTTVLTHTIDMRLTVKGMCSWYLAVKWLHNALLEDALDKAENNFRTVRRHTPKSCWVLMLRNMLRKRT